MDAPRALLQAARHESPRDTQEDEHQVSSTGAWREDGVHKRLAGQFPRIQESEGISSWRPSTVSSSACCWGRRGRTQVISNPSSLPMHQTPSIVTDFECQRLASGGIWKETRNTQELDSFPHDAMQAHSQISLSVELAHGVVLVRSARAGHAHHRRCACDFNHQLHH